VWGPGGYRFRDFVRFGLPLSLLLWGVSMWLIPRAWPF
jgi:di/tricarboxylate transporter